MSDAEAQLLAIMQADAAILAVKREPIALPTRSKKSGDPRNGFRDHPARLKALRKGLTRFDPGEPCARGHTSERFVQSLGCCACQKIRNDRFWAAKRTA